MKPKIVATSTCSPVAIAVSEPESVTKEEMDEEDKLVDNFHSEHYHTYPMVLIHRYHPLPTPTPTPLAGGRRSSCNNSSISIQHLMKKWNDVYKSIHPDRNYAFTPDDKDQVKLGRMVVETVGVSGKVGWDYDPTYFDTEMVSSPHFLISRSSPSTLSVWIRDLESHTGTFVNGKKLEPKCKLKVYDGDVVSIGVSHLDPACDLGKPKYFVFKIVVRPTKYSLDEIDVHDSKGRYNSPEVEHVVHNVDGVYNLLAPIEPNEAVLKNPLIVSQIVGYLKFRDLKACRLVNKVWNEQILMLIRRKAQVGFVEPDCIQVDSSMSSLERYNLNFQSQVDVLKTLKIENIRVGLTRNSTVDVLKNISWVVDNFGHQIKYLFLGMNLDNGRDTLMFFNIFNRLTSLKEIKLHLTISLNCKKIKLPKQLETVRVLKINEITFTNSRFRHTRPRPNPANQSIVSEFLNLFPNVETATLGGHDFMTMFLTLPRNNLLLGNLKTLEVELFFMNGYTLWFLRGLKTFPRLGLKNLIISGLRFNQRTIDGWTEALSRHAPTLESLKLLTDVNMEESVEIIFPRLPKLKRLDINVKGTSVFDYAVGSPMMTWKFPSGEVVYKEDFPLLEDLNLTLRLFENRQLSRVAKNLIEGFVPFGTRAHENKCVTMKRVHFTTPRAIPGEDDQTWGRNFSRSFENIFPNAIFDTTLLD